MDNELFNRTSFEGFGPSFLKTADPASLFVRIDGKENALKELVRTSCPRSPGVYGFIGTDDALLYVGKAKQLRTRLLSYFRETNPDAKAHYLVKRARAIVWEQTWDEFSALLRELELIRRWRPPNNVQGQPGRRRPVYVCVGRAPAPYAFLSRQPTGKITDIFGPVSGSSRATEAVRRLNDWFGLRDCPQSVTMHFADQPGLFEDDLQAKCMRHDFGTCSGPCVAACTRTDYSQQVRSARSFLRGVNRHPLTVLEARIKEAAGRQAYELAARLRDIHADLEWLDRQLERLRVAQRDFSFIYPMKSHDGGERWYFINGGQVLAQCRAPACPATRDAARLILKSVITTPTWGDRHDRADYLFLVAAWFHRHPDERERVLSTTQALALAG